MIYWSRFRGRSRRGGGLAGSDLFELCFGMLDRVLCRILEPQFIAMQRRVKRRVTVRADPRLGGDRSRTLMTNAQQMRNARNLTSVHPELMGTGAPDNGVGRELASLSFTHHDGITASGSKRCLAVSNKPRAHGNLCGHATQWLKESLTLFTAVRGVLDMPAVWTGKGAFGLGSVCIHWRLIPAL